MENNFVSLGGRVVTYLDPEYNSLRRGYNYSINQFPYIINYCESEEDIKRAILWARGSNIPIRIRGGGHNYEGYSNGNYAFVIDLSLMKNIEINEGENTVTIQGGVTNKDLYGFLAAYGYPFPGGTCPSVGVFGFALGGGWGLSSRKFGLGCDNVSEFRMINYKGEVITASANENQDLYWALRGGGGGNFGVVTSITFNLPPKIEEVTLIEIDYENVNPRQQEKLFLAWQNYVAKNNENLTLISRIYNSKEEGLSMLVRGFYYGEAEEARNLLKEFLETGNPIYNIQKMPFIEAVNIIGSSYPQNEKFRSASGFVYRRLTLCEIMCLVNIVKKLPYYSEYIALSMYALGGKAGEVKPHDTAFYHRKAGYIIWLDTKFEKNMYTTNNQKWIDEKYRILRNYTAGAYVNFPYRNLSHYKEEYYGGNVASLLSVKGKYDPVNVFGFPQGILGNNSYCYEESPYPQEGLSLEEERTQEKANYREFRFVKDIKKENQP
ncbi:MAG: FAD-binding oxidoreductase [Clostridiaceae bacterium]|nr:FAD-binding oxidoreductase [Clostridiaceae bacterium]